MSTSPEAGNLLIAQPFMDDPNFTRAVVLLCEYDHEGAVGLILNNKLKAQLADVLPETDEQYEQAFEIPLYYGGPCEPNTLHFLHNIHTLPNAQEVSKGLYWGGDFEVLKMLIKSGEVANYITRFFIGYSGWGYKQLRKELANKDWIIHQQQQLDNIFIENDTELWKQILKNKGGEFTNMANLPIDPRLN